LGSPSNWSGSIATAGAAEHLLVLNGDVPLITPQTLSALARAHVVVAAGARDVDDTAEVTDALARYAPDVPVIPAAYVATECWDARRMQPVALDDLRSARVLAFAGIGAPDGFRRTLDELGATVAELIAFDDHYWYASTDVERLVERARTLGVDALVTTEKDWVRLLRLGAARMPLWVVSVRLELLGGVDRWRAAFMRTCRTS
jgi:tetraacyldisaccharide 4'-kinase